MSAAIAALVGFAPGVAHGMTEIGAVEASVPVRVLPIAGPHDLGRSPTNGFGGGRGHSGQDMFAACGTPVVASQGGRVRKAGYHPVGGNFVVLTEKHTGLDAVYMHLANPPRLRAREAVETNERIGSVGDSGNASGCHLHFELWSAPGWYAGGEPFDPLPRLQRWDARSQTRSRTSRFARKDVAGNSQQPRSLDPIRSPTSAAAPHPRDDEAGQRGADPRRQGIRKRRDARPRFVSLVEGRASRWET